MKTDDVERELLAQRWKNPNPEFLSAVLDLAQSEQAKATSDKESKPFISRRWFVPLAACWILSLAFRLSTPELSPSTSAGVAMDFTGVTPAQLVAYFKNVEKLAHELTDHRHRTTPPPPL